jgi:hypothetical protein
MQTRVWLPRSLGRSLGLIRTLAQRRLSRRVTIGCVSTLIWLLVAAAYVGYPSFLGLPRPSTLRSMIVGFLVLLHLYFVWFRPKGELLCAVADHLVSAAIIICLMLRE